MRAPAGQRRFIRRECDCQQKVGWSVGFAAAEPRGLAVAAAYQRIDRHVVTLTAMS
jgi:hypothetical protein